ncbi:MAG: hypothetical protein WC588_01275 [Candidatus Micrarchaeia archaeon]
MEGDGSIRTQLDDLLANLKAAGGKPLSARELSSSCNMPASDVVKWLSILERSGKVHLQNRIEGVYASWAGERQAGPDEKTKPYSDGAIYAGRDEVPSEVSSYESAQAKKSELKRKHMLIIESADAELASAADKLVRIDEMLSEYQRRKAALAAKSEGAAIIAPLPEEKEAQAPIPEAEKIPQAEETPARTHEETESVEIVQLPIPKEEQPAREERPIPSPKPKRLIPTIIPIPRSKAKAKIEKIRKPEPVQITNVSLQFSEKLAKQVRRIVSQSQEIEKLRMEKERLLTEHYMPMQRKLECEIETISERVLRMEKGVLNMQERASALPGSVSSVEKLQISTIKAHAEMKKAYDEASALIEESTFQLAEERGKLELLANQSREDIFSHQMKTSELQKTLGSIAEMERESDEMVSSARAALSEQAERLAAAESHSRELSALKDEISSGVESIKREVSVTKGMLTSFEKQMEEMRHVEEWANAVRQDYEGKMREIDEYIRSGNREFETLRESVEANFVRRYLHELRSLTDSYSFEFNQAKNSEETLEERISKEKRKLEQIIEDGRQLAYLYETRAGKADAGLDFERHGAAFGSMSDISSQRTQLEAAIAQVVGKRGGHQRVSAQGTFGAEEGRKENETRGEEKPVFAKRQPLAPRTIDRVHAKAPAKTKHRASKAAPASRKGSDRKGKKGRR